MEKKQPFLNQVSIADQVVLDLAQDTFEGAFPDLRQLMAELPDEPRQNHFSATGESVAAGESNGRATESVHN